MRFNDGVGVPVPSSVIFTELSPIAIESTAMVSNFHRP